MRASPEVVGRTFGQQYWPCCWDGCDQPAAAAVTFVGQAGHVHDCAAHVAVLREWCDVAEVVSLPCPWVHGAIWTDAPADLPV